MSSTSFLVRYAESFARIPGWFSIDAYLLMCLYHLLALPPGDVLEIGVYQGLSAIGVAALRGPNRRFFAIDPFLAKGGIKQPSLRDGFLRTMREFYGTLDFMELHETRSSAVQASDLDGTFSLVHVDGDHAARGVLHDLELAHSLLEPGGVLVLDDYYNPYYPGVSLALHEYLRVEPRRFRVVAGGLNKLILQREPVSNDVNSIVRERFAKISGVPVKMWDRTALLYSWGIGVLFDLEKSTPHALFLNPTPNLRAKVESKIKHARVVQGETVQIPVTITNMSSFAFQAGEFEPIKLGGRVRDSKGRTAMEIAPLTALKHILYPEQRMTMLLPIELPVERGRYQIEIDLVWENVAWFRECGNPISQVRLDVV